MKVHPAIVAAAVAAATAGASASTESFRLAFSKAENIEIFVDHAGRSEWCAPALKLRAVHGGEPDQQALAGLLPKLGALLDKQCPQASLIEWTSTTADGKPVARGTSAKADRWAMRTTPVAAAPAAAAPAAPAPEPAAAAPAPVTPQSTAAPTLARPPVATPSSPPLAAEPSASVPAPPTAAAPAQAESPAAPTTTAIGDFEINGWKPLDAKQAREQASFLQEFQDQNGCRILTSISRNDLPSLTLKSEQLVCGPDGYANGKGRLVLDRSDGVRVGRTGMMWFVKGVPVNQEMGSAQLTGSDDRQTLWFFLGSDAASKSHFLLPAQRNSQNGISVWAPAAQIDAITGDESQFRQAVPIQAAVDAALAAFDRNGWRGARWVKLVFANDFAKMAGPARDSNHLVYEIQPTRQPARRGTDGPGSWQVNLQRATNHLFQRDARIAQQKTMEEQRAARQKAMEEQRAAQQKAMEEQREAQRQRQAAIQKANAERRKLQTYQGFVDAAGDPNRLLSSLESDLDYTPGSGGSYVGALGGGQHRISRIVHVSGRDGGDASVDFPYEMRLLGQRELKAGWYRIEGAVTLDDKRRDREDLPLTLVTIAADAPHACQKEGCADLLDPLVLTRLKLGEPDWTPEAATAVIESALRP